MEGISKNLENGLKVSIDWLSFTITELSYVKDVLSLLGYSQEDFNEMPHGRYGYKSMLLLNGYSVSILYDGNSDMGIHVDISGTAILEVIRSFKSTLEMDTLFGIGYEIDFDSTFMREFLSAIDKLGHITRIDFAIDDIGAHYFTTDELYSLWRKNLIVTKFRKLRNVEETASNGIKTSHTVYFGSRESEMYLRVYDKQLEQNKKLTYSDSPLISTPWVRWEMECKGSRCYAVLKQFLDGSDLGYIAVGILSQYVRIINSDNSNRSRCTVNAKWLDFLHMIQSLKLYVPQKEKTMEDKKSWFNKQVMPTMAAILIADGGSLKFFEKNLPFACERMKKNLRRLAYEERGKVVPCY